MLKGLRNKKMQWGWRNKKWRKSAYELEKKRKKE